MREIKFRAWDKNIDIMLDPDNLKLSGRGLWSAYYNNCDIEESGWETDPLILNNIELMQYTGLKDKKGKEIYEGDICKTFIEYGEPSDSYVVEYAGERDYPAFDLKDHPEVDCNALSYYRGCGSLEVIGNIYENPELLK